jgi:hypothetical protein
MRKWALVPALMSASLLLVAPAAIARQTAPAPDQNSATVPAPKPKKQRKVCRSIETTSTRMAPQVCKTQAEWDAQVDDRSGENAKRDTPGAGR